MIVRLSTGRSAPTAAAARSETRLKKNASTKLSDSESAKLQSNGQVRLQRLFSSTGRETDMGKAEPGSECCRDQIKEGRGGRNSERGDERRPGQARARPYDSESRSQ